MIMRNLKRDMDEIQLLSRRQAVLLVAFLNLLLYAFFNPGVRTSPAGLAMTALALNAILLLGVGVATLTPAERLRVWWRRRGEGLPRYFSDDAPNWPWLLLSAAVAFGMLATGAFAWYGNAGFQGWKISIAAVQWLAVLVFLVRDVCFLQWCKLTRMRQAVVKGLLYLGLYYVAAAIIGLTLNGVVSENAARIAGSVLTPWMAFDLKDGQILWTVYLGVVLHAALTVVVLRAVYARIARVPGAKQSAAAA